MTAMTPLLELPTLIPSHPAKYSDALIPAMVRFLRGRTRILDPFGGTGKVFSLNHWLPDAQIEAIEIEQEWAAKHPRTTVGNALALPWADGEFDAVCTSPTYGNRMADTSVESSRGNGWQTYTYQLGRQLHPDNSGRLQWGSKYRVFHENAWLEARRVLVEGGAFVLNIKDHIRSKQRAHVTDWHIECLVGLGFRLVEHAKIDTPSMTHGQNREARVRYESVILFELERKP